MRNVQGPFISVHNNRGYQMCLRDLFCTLAIHWNTELRQIQGLDLSSKIFTSTTEVKVTPRRVCHCVCNTLDKFGAYILIVYLVINPCSFLFSVSKKGAVALTYLWGLRANPGGTPGWQQFILIKNTTTAILNRRKYHQVLPRLGYIVKMLFWGNIIIKS